MTIRGAIAMDTAGFGDSAAGDAPASIERGLVAASPELLSFRLCRS